MWRVPWVFSVFFSDTPGAGKACNKEPPTDMKEKKEEKEKRKNLIFLVKVIGK
jgi:hypothetical protein